MTTSITKIAAAIALTALMAGPASAMISKGDLNRDIQSSLSADSNVFVSVDGGVVTLSGYFADAGQQGAALKAAINGEGVDRVINHTHVSN